MSTFSGTGQAPVFTESTSEDPAAPVRRKDRALVRRLESVALPISWIIVIIIFGALRPDEFLTTANFSTIFSSQAVLVVLALGLLVSLRAGDFDLSVASVMVMSSMTVAVLNGQHGVPILLACLIAVGIGVTVGFINGALAVLVKIDPFIVTLGMATLLQGFVLWISDSAPVAGVSEGLVDWVVNNSFLGISVEFYYGIALCIVVWYVFEFTAIGRKLLFVGQNRDVARLSGVNVNRVRWGALIVTSLISALAGILLVGTSGAADPSAGLNSLLPAFAAAFLGATSISPGRFNPWGTVLAVYFLVTGITGLAILGVQTFVQSLFYGGALIIAVTFSQLVRGRNST